MPTTNPVPSTDPTDLLFNAQKLDQVVNGSDQYYTDRLGVNRRTMEGISAAADVVLGGIGYAPPVAYAAGISMTLTTQTVEYSGEIYAPKVVDLPFTTSGVFETAKFRLIQGVAATDLAASGGSAMVGYIPAGTGAVATTVQSKLRETVSVKDFGAVGDGVTDDTAAFVAAMDYIQGQGAFYELASPNNWPSTKRFVLTGPPGIYCFSSQAVAPENARPNYVNFDISFPGSIFKALPSYNHANSLIHMKAAFDYKIEGISFVGFNTSYVIFSDSSLTQNYGGKVVYRDLRFANCQYGIRHELESVVAVIDQCMTDENIIKFLRVWRADQVVIRDGFFSWSQLSRSAYDGFIEFGKDEYTPTGEAAFPGGGTYNIARLNVENCMFIPTGSPGSPVKTAWIDLVSGSVTVRGCHFGPESTNRPITVLSRSVGATYQNVADLADSTITIEDSSCASSFDVVHCYNDYPNYIHLRNIRLNVIDYSNVSTQRYLIGGNAAAINAKTSKYNAAVSEFFRFDIGSTMPQNSNIIAIDPALNFARIVTAHPELCLGDTTNTAASPGTLARFDITDRDFISPSFAHTGGIYEVTITGKIYSTPAGGVQYYVSYKGLLEVAVEGTDIKIGYTQQYTSGLTGLGATPTISAVFLNGTTNGESTSEPSTTLDSGNYRLRIKAVTNLSGNEWQGVVCRVRRII